MVIRSYITIFLAVVSIASWCYAISIYRENKAEIWITLAEMAEDTALPYRLLRLEASPRDEKILIPLLGVRTRDIEDTWGAARSEGRTHEGTDIFAKRGTPIYSATKGYVTRVGTNNLGGNFVMVTGAGGIRYYYAHLHTIAQGIDRGDEVMTDTVLGFAGNTGNAIDTPPHLHFGVYGKDGTENPYPLLINR